jgi:hypothetical protein
MSEKGSQGIKGWWDLSCEELLEAVLNTKSSDVNKISGFDSLKSRIDECLEAGKIKPEQAQKAISHIESLKPRV